MHSTFSIIIVMRNNFFSKKVCRLNFAQTEFIFFHIYSTYTILIQFFYTFALIYKCHKNGFFSWTKDRKRSEKTTLCRWNFPSFTPHCSHNCRSFIKWCSFNLSEGPSLSVPYAANYSLYWSYNLIYFRIFIYIVV